MKNFENAISEVITSRPSCEVVYRGQIAWSILRLDVPETNSIESFFNKTHCLARSSCFSAK